VKQLIVHYEQGVTKVALKEGPHLIEYFVEHASEHQLVGNIYKGRVVNVLPGMQAAFVDIGLSKNAFLYINDLLPAHLDKQPKVKPSISELVREGQEITVQITKEPIGTKGARVTTHFFLPGRWLVYMPEADYVAVSRKIELDTERGRLKELGEAIRAPGEGLILRTVAEGESREALEFDLRFLREIWNNIHGQEHSEQVPREIYRELDMMQRIIRDVFTDQIDELIINDGNKGSEIKAYLKQISPSLAERVKTHQKKLSIFEFYGVEEALDKAFRHKVWMDNGGYLMFDHTEALTVIDVNTGKYTGTVNLEQTVFETNMLAAESIARLLRLRDIGGIIIVDFIDMTQEIHRQQIVERLEQLIKQDRTKAIVVGWTRLGLLEITRKKVREGMDSHTIGICSNCSGSGKVSIRPKL
jgi:ribonuclease G